MEITTYFLIAGLIIILISLTIVFIDSLAREVIVLFLSVVCLGFALIYGPQVGFNMAIKIGKDAADMYEQQNPENVEVENNTKKQTE